MIPFEVIRHGILLKKYIKEFGLPITNEQALIVLSFLHTVNFKNLQRSVYRNKERFDCDKNRLLLWAVKNPHLIKNKYILKEMEDFD